MSFIQKYFGRTIQIRHIRLVKVLIGVSLLFFYLMLDWFMEWILALLGPFVIVFVFIILCINLVLYIILSGYYIGAIKNTLKGIDTLPNWSNLIEIIIDGILYNIATLIITIIAYLPAILLLIVGYFLQRQNLEII